MSDKRMFDKSIVMSDAFLDMSASARCLYFTLCMEADDEGFVGNPKAVMRYINADKTDLDVLLKYRYLLTFPSGVVVIKHWYINNQCRKDRQKPTTYQEELATLKLDSKKAYTEKNKSVNQMSTKCQPNDNQMTTKCGHIGKPTADNSDATIQYNTIQNKANIYIVEIVNYLNDKTNSSYKTNTQSTRKHIQARLSEKYTVEDFKKVIDLKTEQWKGDSNMERYLRPETLFGTKFENYLQEANKSHPKSNASYDLEEYEKHSMFD